MPRTLPRTLRSGARTVAVLGVLVLSAVGMGPGTATAEPVNDEIHFSYGSSAGQVVFSWRGDSNLIEYGPTTDYGTTVTATRSAITPVDDPGPFWEARLTVAPDTTYHYRIGGGEDLTFRSQPSGDFRWADMGDTGSTLCTPWVATTHAQIAAAKPHFVTHGGDISYANECGVPAVHRYYVDQEVWSRSAAFQVVWGNHEYGAPTAEAPAGTPRDSLANYKGRSAVTNPQTVPSDTATRTTHPGCAPAAGSSGNGCRGEDWGWFQVSGVLYIAYPETWAGALSDWRGKADALMAAAQTDPAVDFVVTYGHRPAYSSGRTNAAHVDVTAAVDALADKYSPTARSDGKYVLNVGHHVHGEEAFAPQRGVVHLTNGGGGEGSTAVPSTAAGSVFKSTHPGYLVADYTAATSRLDVRLVCGPQFGDSTRDPCTLGETLYSRTFGKDDPPPPPPTVDHFAGCDTGVEAGLSCFATKYNSNSVLSRVGGGKDSSYAVRIASASTSGGTAGLAAKPAGTYPVTSTALGRTYSGSAWVKAGAAGQKITLQLRERRSDNTSPAATTAVWTATDTNWHLLSASHVGREAGNALQYSIFAALGSGGSVLADTFSLASS